MKKAVWIAVGVSVFLLSLFLFVKYYSFILAKDVDGTVTGVERVSAESALVAPGESREAQRQLFSFAVAVKNHKGEIFTASSEDRRWAVVTPGSCVVARFYPYPFWNLERSGTFYGARLVKLYDCPGSAQ